MARFLLFKMHHFKDYYALQNKYYFFLVIEFGEGKLGGGKNKKNGILYAPGLLLHRFHTFLKLKSIIFNCGFSIKVTREKIGENCLNYALFRSEKCPHFYYKNIMVLLRTLFGTKENL